MENNFQINSINFNKINNIQNNEDILLNRVVDNLKILKQIGKGGFSKTYLAEDENNNYFSIKTIIVGKTDLRLIDLIDRE
jgi:serine/threonine protein kinase